MPPEKGQIIGGHLDVRAMKMAAERGSLRGRHGQASQVWTIVRGLVRPFAYLDQLLHPSAQIRQSFSGHGTYIMT